MELMYAWIVMMDGWMMMTMIGEDKKCEMLVVITND